MAEVLNCGIDIGGVGERSEAASDFRVTACRMDGRGNELEYGEEN
jgi:hypothetical protein